MSEPRADAAYRRALAAFRSPTLDLLHGRYAPFVVAALSLVFTPDRPLVAVADAHAEVTEAVEQLRACGYDEDERGLPTGSGRDICRYWVRVGWLIPQMHDGVEVYRLSAQAVGALELVGRSGAGRSRVSRSRVRTLLEAVDQLVASAETDPERRLARLLAERAELDAAIAQIRAGKVKPADDDQLLEEAENVLHLSQELPADFARVAESIKAMQRDVVTELRRDVRPTGEVLREYLERGQHVMESTSEGRAFAGALRLIGTPEQIDRINEQLASVLDLPFTALLAADQREELRAVAKRIEQGVDEVLTAQRRASHVITAQVRTHDPVRDRELDDLLRSVMAAMQNWMHASSTVDAVEPIRSLPTPALGHLRQSLSDLHPPRKPEPLHSQEDDVEFLDADTREWGGPHYGEIEEYVGTIGTDHFDLAAAFEGMAERTRRPVDLLGLLEIAHRNGMVEGDTVSVVQARRPDGTSRRFAFGSVTAQACPTPTTEDTD
ncbi:DUF3375 domain-containing protein [Actinomyces sp.]|uniref:DUF3375 domain-containing protein n=1 Tax=Actinomyces sp. TaxID=29317 RepID=UPI0026DC14E3|nr:DUF3375 domain-containing protein [Actinomyces sp.]MDO4900955.1 DUF3375 domain-containing protein [Actinomyces sp.]